MRKPSRRDFIGSSAQTAAAGILAQTLKPAGLFGATSPWESDGYGDKTVVRVYDPAVASGYTFGDEYYWRKFDTAVVERMLDTGIMDLAGASSPKGAWKRILPGVSAASRIVVKVNLNNTRKDWKRTALNTSPAMMVALTRSLNKAGVQNSHITFLDCSRPFPDEMAADLLAQCPGVQCKGGAQPESAVTLTMPYGPAYTIPQVVLDADYLISSHLMKKHDGAHTGAIKNFFGMNASGKVTFAHGNPDWRDGTQCRDIITHPEIHKRLKLCIDEAILAAKSPDTLDAYEFVSLFPDGRPSSLFLSRNPFLQDVVGWDFVRAECSRFACREGNTIAWLRNCAGFLPVWNASAIESGALVKGAAGMPPQDIGYNPALLEYRSRLAKGPHAKLA